MNEHYLEWSFLRELLIFWINRDKCVHEGEQFFFNGKEYNAKKMLKRYIKLTELLLKDYELDKEE